MDSRFEHRPSDQDVSSWNASGSPEEEDPDYNGRSFASSRRPTHQTVPDDYDEERPSVSTGIAQQYIEDNVFQDMYLASIPAFVELQERQSKYQHTFAKFTAIKKDLLAHRWKR